MAGKFHPPATRASHPDSANEDMASAESDEEPSPRYPGQMAAPVPSWAERALVGLDPTEYDEDPSPTILVPTEPPIPSWVERTRAGFDSTESDGVSPPKGLVQMMPLVPFKLKRAFANRKLIRGRGQSCHVGPYTERTHPRVPSECARRHYKLFGIRIGRERCSK